MYSYEIRDFDPKDREAFEKLNTEWITKYFCIEPNDRKAFEDPEKNIIGKGGRIFYLYWDNEVLGTVSLVKADAHLYELSKMAVSAKLQGRGAGNLLMQHAIKEARKMGIRKLFLIGNRKLEASIHLYRKYGFCEVPSETHTYERGEIKMELDLP